MRRYLCRSSALETTQPVPPTTAVALDTGGTDLECVDGNWLPCPDAATVLAGKQKPMKLYRGFDPQENLGAWRSEGE